MNLSQLDSNTVELRKHLESNRKNLFESVSMRSFGQTNPLYADVDILSLVDSLDAIQRHRVYSEAISRAERAQSDYRINNQSVLSQEEYINRHNIEWHRKLTLSVACIVLFLVGAPFGSIVRKGGLGLPLVASVIFFVLYYVIGMIVEKAVREGAIGSWGMWVSTLIMLPIGLILTYRAVRN